jgi:hypothetical protein
MDSEETLRDTIDRYNAAWNAHDLDAIMAMQAPDIEFSTRRLYVRPGLVVQEWTATATHAKTMRRGEIEAEPTGNTVTWDGLDVIPFENGLVKRKDVYSDSVSILRQVGLLD